MSNTIAYELTKLNLKTDPLYIDWQQNEKKISKSDKVQLTSTPIFLLSNDTDSKDNDYDYGNPSDYDDNYNYCFGYKAKDDDDDDDGTSGFVIFLEVVGIILLIAIVLIGLLYLYRRFIQKRTIPLDKHILTALLKNDY